MDGQSYVTRGGAGTLYYSNAGGAEAHLVVRSTFDASYETPVSGPAALTAALIEKARVVYAIADQGNKLTIGELELAGS